MMRCIFCLEERAPSVEHIFPDAIGGTLTTDRVCKPCNDHLGAQVDHLLTDHDLIVLKRSMLGMTDRAGKPINPWSRVFGDGHLAADPKQRIQMVADPKTGVIQPRMMYSRTETERDGASDVQIIIDASKAGELPKIISRERMRAGLPALSKEDLAKLVGDLKANVQTIDRPSVRHNIAVDIQDFKRAILKVVYELAWLWLGDDYLGDPLAVGLRDRVYNGSEIELRGRIDFDVSTSAFVAWQAEPDAHIALGRRAGSRYVVGVRVFDNIVALIPVTDNADLYKGSQSSHFVLIDLAGNGSRESTLEQEIARLPKFMRVPSPS